MAGVQGKGNFAKAAEDMSVVTDCIDPEVLKELALRLKEAINFGHVEWLDSEATAFDYLGFRYQVRGKTGEIRTVITEVEKIGRLEIDDDGEVIGVEAIKTLNQRVAENSMWGSW